MSPELFGRPAASTKSLEISEKDPLAKELAAVREWTEAAMQKAGSNFYFGIDLKSLPAGQALLEGDGSQLRRNVLAALAHARHWNLEQEALRSTAKDDHSRFNAHQLPGWTYVRGRALQVNVVFETLMRRKLPFTRDDLLSFLAWSDETCEINRYSFPVSYVCKAILNFASAQDLDPELFAETAKFAGRLRKSRDKDENKHATALEQILGGDSAEEAANVAIALLPSPAPTPFGGPRIQIVLKRSLGIKSSEAGDNTVLLEPDRFPLINLSPLCAEHEFFSKLFVSARDDANQESLSGFIAWLRERLTVDRPREEVGRLLLAITERHTHNILWMNAEGGRIESWHVRYSITEAVAMLMQQEFSVDRDGLFDLLIYLVIESPHNATLDKLRVSLIQQIQAESKKSPLTEGERFALAIFRESLVIGPLFGKAEENIQSVTQLIGDRKQYFLVPGEAWVDSLHLTLGGLPAALKDKWCQLLRHVLTATSSRPSAKWLKNAARYIEEIDPKALANALHELLREFPKGKSKLEFGPQLGRTMNDENVNALRGLLWCIPLLPDRDELARLVTSVAISAYKKVPGVGPRATKVGNAAIYCLSELGTKEAVGQLAMLKVRVKFGSAQKEIEKAFDAAAAALELPRDQIEELGVPSYGLEEVGKLVETLGDYKAELTVNGSDAELRWFDEKGKELKSVPAKVKADHKEELKELQQSLKDIQSMLPAQRDRIDAMFLLQKSWSYSDWRERYYEHPLVGTIARRLIWCIDGAPALFIDDQPTDVRGKPIEHGKTAEITLWHPVGRSVDEITAWRRRLEELQITQPFKQAHREVYLLTEAERNTSTYSNRYAAHIIRQHQFNALCAARRWKNKLRLCVDDYFPPATRELPLWGLRAEFWIEGLGDDFGVDTNDSGVYLRLTTDQVRFYRDAASTNFAHAGGGGYGGNATGPGTNNVNEPLPLDQIPPLVFSEIMRDVDLFVGVASIGNDPTWQDGGPQGRYRDYWQGYSFGELSGTATTRKEVLQRLVPRLKIANRCSFNDRFLVVRGDKRTYKIHLGSGNILMEPNDQYLCIVPDAKTRASQDDMYLPFEGDNTLSIIISKALLLADDVKIKDPTITRQIALS
jgi:hypothetical protein